MQAAVLPAWDGFGRPLARRAGCWESYLGKTNQMRAQEEKLTSAQIHVLTGYVWGLSHGNPQAAAKQ